MPVTSPSRKNFLAASRDVFRRAARSRWFWLIFGAYALRLLLAPLAGQHDVMFMAWQAHFINLGHLNLYAYLHRAFGDTVLGPIVWAPYPYGFYAYTAGWLWLLERLQVVDLAQWSAVWEVAHPARLVFFLKLAYLPFDLGIGYLLSRCGGRRASPLAWALWAWSPLAVYTPFLMGQNDLYAVAALTAGVFGAYRALGSPRANRRAGLAWAAFSALALGVGAAFKVFPLIWLPVLALLLPFGWWMRLLYLALGVSPFVVSTLPFLRTPAFVQGVLTNPEGVKIFRELDLLGFPFAPFLAVYAGLLLFLAARSGQRSRPEAAWEASLLLMAALFLLTPAPFYWWIWLAPFLAAVVALSAGPRRTWGLLVWACFGLVFALLLQNQHRELAAGLPVHLSGEFNFPNLTEAARLTAPTLARLLQWLWVALNSAMAALFLVMIIYPAQGLLQGGSPAPSRAAGEDPRPARRFIPLPLLLTGLALLGSLFAARRLVAAPLAAAWETRELASGMGSLLQSLPAGAPAVNGARLRYLPAAGAPAASLQACLVDLEPTADEPLACARADTGQALEGKYLYFLFDRPVPVEPGREYGLQFQVLGEEGAVTLPYAPDLPGELRWGPELLPGRLDLAFLHTFSPASAAGTLLVENILRDPALLLGLPLTVLLTFAAAAWIYAALPNPPD